MCMQGEALLHGDTLERVADTHTGGRAAQTTGAHKDGSVDCQLA